MLLDEAVAVPFLQRCERSASRSPLRRSPEREGISASLSEAAMGDALQHHEPPAIVQSQEQSSGQPIEQPNERPEGG